jgi:sodium/proline symporter
MINIAELITFAMCFIALMGVGWYFYKRTVHIENYLLGGRRMGRWVTALSAQASDMSGWLLMGLPGAVFLMGVNQSWIAIGLFLGTVVNWLMVAPRLRAFTGHTESLTISSFLEERFQDPTGLLRYENKIRFSARRCHGSGRKHIQRRLRRWGRNWGCIPLSAGVVRNSSRRSTLIL